MCWWIYVKNTMIYHGYVITFKYFAPKEALHIYRGMEMDSTLIKKRQIIIWKYPPNRTARAKKCCKRKKMKQQAKT
jgi:hypothetical protein